MLHNHYFIRHQLIMYDESTMKIIWALAAAYVLVGLGLFYSLAIDSSELFLGMTALIYFLMSPLAYLIYKKRVVNE